MLIELTLSSIAALLLGILTGLTPGIHNNTITAILITLIPTLSLNPLTLIVFVVVLALTHTILDFVPSIFTGATDGESFMATLPGHDMLNEGKGIEAVAATTTGASRRDFGFPCACGEGLLEGPGLKKRTSGESCGSALPYTSGYVLLRGKRSGKLAIPDRQKKQPGRKLY